MASRTFDNPYNTSTITATNITSGATVTVRKKESVVRIDCGVESGSSLTLTKTNTGASQTIPFATLPSEAIPPANVYFPVLVRRSGQTVFDPIDNYGVIYTNGNVGLNIKETVTIVQMVFGQTYFAN